MRRALLALTLSLTLAGVAHAQSEAPSASAVDTARTEFQQALELRDKRHDLRGATEKLKAAYALVPTPRIGLELGKTYQQMGQLVEARAAFLDVDRLPQTMVVAGIKKAESAEAKKAREDARHAASDLDARIPSMLIQVRGVGQVSVDGESVSGDALSAPRRVNPGRHVVALSVDGAVSSRKIVDLHEGSDTTTVVLEARSDDDGASVTPVGPQATPGFKPPTDAAPPNRARSALTTVGYTLVGVGLASDLISYVVASSAIKQCDSVTKHCDSLSGKTTSLAFAVVGDVLVGAGIVSFIVALAMPRTSSPTAPEVGFSPTTGGGLLSAKGRF